MQRLTYSPKAYAFIYSSNLNKVIDVSEDIISGSVNRKVNDFSTARLTLRNLPVPGSPHGKYTQRGSTQVFLPNDLITIWLQRVAGKPVQVFTGYLDEVPMFEMYPRAVELSATCTLKRLAYGWFDPGLEFFQNWMATVGAADGWVYNPTTGEATSPLLNMGIDGQNAANGNTPGEHTVKSLDGGFARLLHEFMTQIAGWDQRRIHISNLDPELPTKAAELYSKISEAGVENQARLAVAMREMMGVSLVGNKDGVDPTGTLEPEITQALKLIKPVATQYNIPMKFMVFAAIHQTAFDPAYAHGPETGKLYGYGLYKRKLDGPLDAQILLGSEPKLPGGVKPVPVIRGSAPASLSNVTTASSVFGRDAVEALEDLFPSNNLYGSTVSASARKSFINSVSEGDADNTKRWFDAYLKRFGSLDENGTNLERYTHDLKVADTYVKSFTTGAPVEQPEVDGETRYKVETWDSETILGLLDSDEKAMVRDHYSKHLAELAPYVYVAKKKHKGLKLFWSDTVRKEEVVFKYTGNEKPDASASPAYQFFKSLAGHDNTESVHLYDSRFNGHIAQFALHKGAQTTGAVNDTPTALVKAQAGLSIEVKEGAPAPDWLDLPVEYEPEAEEETGEEGLAAGFKFEDLGRFTANAALAAKYAFPVSYIESHFQTGARSLQNDIPVMDGVKQFCQASLRNYMSLPDGSFLAFYPDYFGAKRKPYWWIPDIEIIDMRIQLNDHNLATHVYVTGDTFNRNDAIDEWDRILTRGVVTINDVALLGAMMDPGNPSVPLNPEAFLNHYGARPIAEENPLIRNHFYEFLMAWQRFMQLWATQFATSVDFTFQPEVMAGGLVGFKDHNLQMYVEEVEHTFAYDESGFNTTAILSAPSRVTPPGVARTPDQFPGLVPAGAANTVGAA